MSLNTFSSIFKWLEMPLVDVPEWLDYLPKAGENNG